MFEYEPLTEEEAMKARVNLLDEGIYEFEVMSATFEISKNSGNKMIKLVLKVLDDQSNEHVIFDYLIGTKQMGWKSKHFCDSVGLQNEYQNKQFNETLCKGKRGKVLIKIKQGDLKADGSSYPPKNTVDDYVMTDMGALKYQAPESAFNDAIPF